MCYDHKMVYLESVSLLRFDIEKDNEEESTKIIKISPEECPGNKVDLIQKFDLPKDSVVQLKLKTNSGEKSIPWSLLFSCKVVEIHIFRPNQDIKPNYIEQVKPDYNLIVERVGRLESRISSLEINLDQSTIDMKNERDLQLLSKQTAFLSNRLVEADKADWIKRT